LLTFAHFFTSAKLRGLSKADNTHIVVKKSVRNSSMQVDSIVLLYLKIGISTLT